MSQPAETKALLVGIEKYEAGSNWNLNGPAKDVLRMANWLCKQGVPPENLTIFLSPLDQNKQQIEEAEILTGYKPATEAEIRDTLSRELQGQSGSLFFYWGGHGWVTQEGERRLFYADAIDTDLKNLDFNDQLLAFRSDLFAGLPRQLFIVDACANYAGGMRANPPSHKASKGELLSSHEQFVLLAARPGDFAQNIDNEQTGLYTRELMAELEQQPIGGAWPPDMEEICARLQRKFVDLRTNGLAEQTPAYLWNRDWIGNERPFGKIPVAPAPTTEAMSSITLPKKLMPQELAHLRDMFVQCDSLRDYYKRNQIVDMLRTEILVNINRSPDITTDILNIIRTCRNYQKGLSELLNAISVYESGTSQFQLLKQELARMLPEEIVIKDE